MFHHERSIARLSTRRAARRLLTAYRRSQLFNYLTVPTCLPTRDTSPDPNQH